MEIIHALRQVSAEVLHLVVVVDVRAAHLEALVVSIRRLLPATLWR